MKGDSSYIKSANALNQQILAFYKGISHANYYSQLTSISDRNAKLTESNHSDIGFRTEGLTYVKPNAAPFVTPMLKRKLPKLHESFMPQVKAILARDVKMHNTLSVLSRVLERLIKEHDNYGMYLKACKLLKLPVDGAIGAAEATVIATLPYPNINPVTHSMLESVRPALVELEVINSMLGD